MFAASVLSVSLAVAVIVPLTFTASTRTSLEMHCLLKDASVAVTVAKILMPACVFVAIVNRWKLVAVALVRAHGLPTIWLLVVNEFWVLPLEFVYREVEKIKLPGTPEPVDAPACMFNDPPFLSVPVALGAVIVTVPAVADCDHDNDVAVPKTTPPPKRFAVEFTVIVENVPPAAVNGASALLSPSLARNVVPLFVSIGKLADVPPM